MGVVYAARDGKLRRDVALKMLRPGGAGDATQAKMRERLLREARAMAQLSHPNVLPVYDVGELAGDIFVAMELVDGGTLRTWLREKRRSWREVLEAFLAAARGLAAAHAAGLIHRDFKPDNVLVGNDGRIRVMDFGLASAAAPDLATPAGRDEGSIRSLSGTGLAGSPAYMAPEQMHGEASDARADVFSYSVALYEGLYGERPFAGDSVAELEAAILRGEVRKPRRANGTPAWIRRVVLRGLHSAPKERYPSIDAIVAALEKGRSGARKRAAAAAVVLAVAALAGSISAPAIRARIGERVSRRPPPEGESPVQAGSADVHVRPSATSNSKGYDLYLRGKIRLRLRSEEDTQAAIRLLEQATSLDPDFAAAQAELAIAYGQWVSWFAADDKVALERAQLAEAKALRLNPDLPDAHFASASLLEWTIPPRYVHERAVRELKRALALDPSYGRARQMLGNIYLHIGLIDEAVAEIQKAVDSDPTSPAPTLLLSVAHISRGEYEEALRILRQVPKETNSSVWEFTLAWALLYSGRSQEAWESMDGYLREHPEDRGGVVTSLRAIWFAKAGDRRRAEADIRAAVEKGKGYVHFHHAAYNIGSAYSLLGNAPRAVHWLRIAAETGWPCYPHIAGDPNLAKIRKDAGYAAFIAELSVQWERYRAMF